MIKTISSITASRVIVDLFTNQVSIIDVYEGFKSQAFPIILPNFSILFNLQRDAGDPSENNLSLKCTIEGIEVVKVGVTANFQHGNFTRSIVGFEGFMIPNSGILKLELMHPESEEVISELKLPVDELEIPQTKVLPTGST